MSEGEMMTCSHAYDCTHKENCSRFKEHHWTTNGCDKKGCEKNIFEDAHCVPVKKGIDVKGILSKAFPGSRVV